MKIQELIAESHLGLDFNQVKSFILGGLSADRPMTFPKLMDEIFAEAPEERQKLESEFKNFYNELSSQRSSELAQLFSTSDDLETIKDKLDFFLTALALGGTTAETCRNEELAPLIDELEDMIEDLEDYLSEGEKSSEVEEELSEFVLTTWKDFVKFRR